MRPPARTQFLGLAFDPVGADQAARAIAERARSLAPFAYVATPNVDHIVRLDRRPELRPLYAEAWLNLCDSRILEILAELSRMFLPAAPGADIMEHLFRSHIRRDDTVVVIGGSSDIVDAIRRRHGLTDVRWFDAPYGLNDDPAARAQCVAFIRNNPAPFAFLAVGSPQQEMIAHEAMTSGDAVGVALCCGAALEFLVGERNRAPGWMRANRLEWLHRLVSEPGRLWRRYLVDGPRVFRIWRRWSATTH
ncbi:MAG: WecB/TagA/CpsF family glycosyltransferase [Hyphomonadaceae bacterium]